MTPLRQRMIDDMRLAGFAKQTQDVYIQAIRRLAAHYMRSPEVLSEEEVRTYLLHLRDERGVARGTFKTNHGGIRFLYLRTLDRDWPLFSQVAAAQGQLARTHSGARSVSPPVPPASSVKSIPTDCATATQHGFSSRAPRHVWCRSCSATSTSQRPPSISI